MQNLPPGPSGPVPTGGEPLNLPPPPPTSTTAEKLAEMLQKFWLEQRDICMAYTEDDFKKAQELPLARIKKIMKCDEDVKMISAEVPILFSKACELFILNLTKRAWIFTEEHKRKTLKRDDIVMAISKCDVFDFLIDIVPREEKMINVKKQEDQIRQYTEQQKIYVQQVQQQQLQHMQQLQLYQQQQQQLQQEQQRAQQRAQHRQQQEIHQADEQFSSLQQQQQVQQNYHNTGQLR